MLRQNGVPSYKIKLTTLCNEDIFDALVNFVVVQSLSHVWLFATPWTAACQASLFFIISWSLLKLMFIESVMPFNHLILCHPLLLLPFVFPSIRVFSMSQLFKSGGQSIGTSALASFLPMNIQDWFSLGLIYLHWWIRIIKSRVFKICLWTRTLVMSPNLIAIIGNNLINRTFPLTSCDAQKNLSRLLITQNKSWSIMLAIEKGIKNFLSYEKTIKDYAVKKFVAKKIFQRGIGQLGLLWWCIW